MSTAGCARCCGLIQSAELHNQSDIKRSIDDAMHANDLKPVSGLFRPGVIAALIFAMLVIRFANLDYRSHVADARDLVD